jgi:hypothetical protein
VRRLAIAVALLGILAPAARAAAPHVRHVFIIVLENESAAKTFGPGSPAPYLSGTLRAAGAYLPRYLAVGHESNDDYIAMISGQAPNVETQADCPLYVNLSPGTLGAYGEAQGLGCIYSAAVPTIASQLQAAGLTWRDYNEGMGADPAREPSECGHPGIGMLDNTQRATATDEYATRHNPFVYFHGVIDDTALCDSRVVGLDALPHDLRAAADTPNYVFITPDLCDDGHDSPCKDGRHGGLGQADAFLRAWVPRIRRSPAFLEQNGLLMILFDEASTSDASSCCGEIAGPGSPLPGIVGSGGGDTGAVLLSPCIAPATVSQTPYNHYSMLRSVEDLFGLSHIGYAQLPGETSFGSDVFSRKCGPPPKVRVQTQLRGSLGEVRWRARGEPVAYFVVQLRKDGSRWQTLLRRTRHHALEVTLRPGRRYRFRVRAIALNGAYSRWSTATVRPRAGS